MKATLDVQLGPSIRVRGARIFTRRDGSLGVSMPSRRNPSGVWEPVVELAPHVMGRVTEAAIEAYGTPSAAPGPSDDIPF